MGNTDAVTEPPQAVGEGWLSGRAAWRADGVLSLEPSLVDKAVRRRFSVSSAQAISSCPARFAIDKILPRTADPFGAAELGSATHRLFEELFKLPRELRTIDVAMDILEDLHSGPSDLTLPEEHDLSRWRAEIEHRAIGLWQIEDPTSVEVSGTEVKISSVTVAGVPFVGFVDRLDIVGGHQRVVDYKAGLSAPKKPGRYGDPHGDQARLYAVAIEQLRGVRPLEAEIYYTPHGVKRSISLAPRKVATTIGWFSSAWDEMLMSKERGGFSTKPSPLCGWCPLVKVCPTARAAGRTARDPIGDVGPGLGIAAPPPTPVALGDTRVPVGPQSAPVSSTATADRPRGRTRTMSRGEAPAYEETLPDGSINLNSFAAMASFGLAEFAIDTLQAANVPLRRTTVAAMALTFKKLVADVARNYGTASMQAGLHSRLRGALRTTIETMPPPFGGTDEDWQAWADKVERRLVSIAETALMLWETEPSDAPWAVFAREITPAAA
jgi:putative RecB family exonuclease